MSKPQRPTLTFLKVFRYFNGEQHFSIGNTTIDTLAKNLYLLACINALRQLDILNSNARIVGLADEKDCAHSVLSSENREEALANVDQNHQELDVIMLDLYNGS